MVDSCIEPFRTSETVLAAYLISAGFNTPAIDFVNGSKAYFVFPRDNADLEPFINDFNSGRATSNVVVFMAAYQNLIRRIKERY
jgi:hypothetical protein